VVRGVMRSTMQLGKATFPSIQSASSGSLIAAWETTAVRAAFPGRVRGVDAVGTEDILLLDGGATSGPVPSTIVTLAGAHAYSPRILRKGVLSSADLERVAGVNVAEQTAQATHNKPEVGA